jgi:hypothetical protein
VLARYKALVQKCLTELTALNPPQNRAQLDQWFKKIKAQRTWTKFEQLAKELEPFKGGPNDVSTKLYNEMRWFGLDSAVEAYDAYRRMDDIPEDEWVPGNDDEARLAYSEGFEGFLHYSLPRVIELCKNLLKRLG